jgi:HlyD family secretion protein
MNTSTRWIWTAAAGLAAVGLLAWAFAPRPIEVETAPVTRGHFESGIDEDGKTRLRDRYVVSAPLAGVLSRIGLREGDAVDADAVVATLRPTLSPMVDERTLREQQARLETAQAQVDRATARVEGAKVALTQAKNEAQRSEQLARQGFVSATKLDSDRLAAQAAQKDLDAATEERHIAGHEVEQARAALSAVRGTDRRGFALRAPIRGRVLKVAQTSETTVAMGTPLIEVGNTARLEVVAELLTTDALKARPGAKVRIERWGGSVPLEGRVRSVEPAAFTKVSALGVEEQRVKVLVDLVSPPQEWQALGDGFRVSVRIVTVSVDQAVQVPVSAVFPLPDREGEAHSRTAVFVLDGGHARAAVVTVGGRNGTHAWLQTGPSPGAAVIVYPPASLVDGARVKARKV